MTKRMDIMINDNDVTYGGITWDKSDLSSAKNGAWRVYDTYGLDAVKALDAAGLFGGLDTMAALAD